MPNLAPCVASHAVMRARAHTVGWTDPIVSELRPAYA